MTEEENNEKKKRKGAKGFIDKLFMGAVVGGAIGSVVGMSIAPKKGKETRKLLKSKVSKMFKRGKTELKKHEKEIDIIKQTARQQGEKLFNFIDSKKQKIDEEEMRKIPHEE